RRISQAGGSRADDGDALAARRPPIGNHRLAAGRGVDHAANARTAAHIVDAGVAGETAPDRLLAAKLRDPLRIGDEGAAERDEIRLSRRHGLSRGCGIAEAPDGDHRNADHFFDGGREVEKGCVRKGHRRGYELGRRVGGKGGGGGRWGRPPPPPPPPPPPAAPPPPPSPPP